jgi:lipopolysaccharide/colanic/teichoic acid biosynthesis glycosyltransferase
MSDQVVRNSVNLYPINIYPVVKRFLDITVASIALLMLLPLFCIIGLMIKLNSSGPILYSQTRVGKNKKLFKFYKFRSMQTNTHQLRTTIVNQHTGITFKNQNDPRITSVGKVLRKYSLDELPQLWNVLMGEMSLVGPRPALEEEVAQYSQSDLIRLSVIPGLTCIWQVSGRANLPFDKQVQMDREYILKRSLQFDIMLLVLTIPAVITGKGAY